MKDIFNCIQENDIESIKLLVEDAETKKRITKDGKYPLHFACTVGNIEIVKLLIDHGFDIHQRDRSKWYSKPLSDAIVQEHLDIIKYIVSTNGYQVSSEELYTAVTTFEIDIVDILLKTGVDINIGENSEDSILTRLLLWYKPEHMVLEMLKFLIEHGANCNFVREVYPNDPYLISYNNESLLQLAVYENNILFVKTLLDYDVDLEYKNNLGMTALHYAFTELDYPHSGRRLEIIDLLIQKGANINALTSYRHTPISQCIIKGRYNNCTDEEIVVFLKKYLNCGLRLDIKDIDGQTMLHLSAIYDRYEVVSFLLENGAKINVTDNANRTPLMCSAIQKNPRITELLLKYNPDTSIEDDDQKTFYDLVNESDNEELKKYVSTKSQ